MSEGKQPGKVRKATSRAWGSLYGQEVLGQEETAQVMRQELFGVEMQLFTQVGEGSGDVSWPCWHVLLPGERKVTCGLWTLTGWETHGQHTELGALSWDVRSPGFSGWFFAFFSSEAAVSSLFLVVHALSDLADPRLGCLPIPLFLTHPIRLSKPVFSVNKEKKTLGLKGNRRSPCFSVTFNFQPLVSVEIEM